jgi:hypothetical protein
MHLLWKYCWTFCERTVRGGFEMVNLIGEWVLFDLDSWLEGEYDRQGMGEYDVFVGPCDWGLPSIFILFVLSN